MTSKEALEYFREFFRHQSPYELNKDKLDTIEKDLDKLEYIKQLMFHLLIVDNRPVKNTTRKACYAVLEKIQEVLETNSVKEILKEWLKYE